MSFPRAHLHRIGTLILLSLLAGAVVVPRHPTAASPPALQSRPQLSGQELTHGTAHFLIHYTHIGVDAIPPGDTDHDNVPDWVEEVGVVMEAIRRVQVDALGWPAPISDRGEGGDERFDVYLMELFSQNIAGYVSPDGGTIGDNPATPRAEARAAYGYMVLDNDYIDPSPPAGLRVWPPEDWLRIIAAHEFNHTLQIALNGGHAMRWWYEATANWMETQVFPHLPDNLESAGAVFKSPDTCMLRFGGVNRVESGLHWYGMWVFNQMLAEHFGPDIVLDIWYAIGDQAGYGPFDEVFAARGTTFEDEVRRFAIKVLLRDFQNGARYPVARLQEAVTGPGTWSPADGVQRYAMDYIGLDLGAGTYTVTLESDDPGVEAMVVGVRGGTVADIYPAGRSITVDFSAYDHAYLAVVNLTRPPNEAGCATARYAYAVEEAAGDTTGVWYNVNAIHFAAPQVEAVTDPDDIPGLNPLYQTEYNIRDEIRTVDLPFRPITPRGAPDGYELDSVYGVDADALDEEFRALNAPSGGTVVQMLYYNSSGQLLRITESPTVYVTIGEWMVVNGLEFQPGVQVWTAGSVDTAVVDRSGGGGGPYLVAFIVRERFMVIDGDAPLEAMLDMASRFATSFGAELPEPRSPYQTGFVRPAGP